MREEPPRGPFILGTSDSEWKLRHEWVTFTEFCAVAKLSLIPESVCQPDPPDIMARFSDAGLQAFELVRLADPKTIQRERLMPWGYDYLYQYHQTLTRSTRTAFDWLFANSYISVHFDYSVSKKALEKSLPGLFGALMNLPERTCGVVLEGSVPGIRWVYVGSSADTKGPVFAAPADGMRLPLELERISKKLRKAYACSVALNLLAYASEVADIDDCKRLPIVIEAGLSGSAFKRVWIYETMLARVSLYGPAMISG